MLAALTSAAPAQAEARFDCVIEPSLSLELGSPVPGLLAEAMVGRGDVVEKGQVVARLQDRIEQASVALLSARAESEANIESRIARLKLAEQTYDRVKQLKDRDIATAQALEESEATVEIARRDLAEAELERRLAALELNRAREVLDQRAIRSPVAGWVMDRHLSPGEYVHQEAPIMSIAQPDPLYVESFVPVRYFPAFRPGMTGSVEPGAPIEGRFDATVTVVDRVFDASSGTFRVRLSLPNPDAALPAGQRCEVAFDIDE